MGDIYTNPPQSRNEAILRATIDGTEYTDPPQSRIEDLLIELKGAIEGGSVSSYTDLTDKPSINGVTLTGDKTTQDLKILDGSVPYLLSDVSDVLVVADGQDVTITWTDPIDIVDGETVITAWAGTKVVRKVGSAPDNVYDGDVVVDSKTRNQYSTNGYVDEVLANGTYYYRFFPYSSNGVYTQGEQIASATIIQSVVYGVEWDGTATTKWNRTDGAENFSDPNPYYDGMTSTPSSPFDNIMPWSGMEIVEDSNAGTLVKIPKFWYKWTRDGVKMKLQIADGEVDGFSVSPAHMARNENETDRDYVYIGRYHCTSDYKSKTGVLPEDNHTRAEFRTNIHSLGSDIWQNDYAMFWTIRMLYLVEFADWDSQTKIGYGNTTTSSTEIMGYTDSMPYHTGTTKSSRTTYGASTQYRYIEGLWDNVYDWCDGIYFREFYIFGILDPSKFSDSFGGQNIGMRVGATGYISEWNNYPTTDDFKWALFPSAIGGTPETYVCDRYNCSYTQVSTSTVIKTGGTFNQDLESGMFKMAVADNASSAQKYTGSRLMKLP